MKLLCKCGNIFDFSKEDNSTIEGFSFMRLNVDGEDTLAIHCKKCDVAVCLTGEE